MPKEPATETKAKGCRCFGLPHQRGIVELQLFHGGAQLFKLAGLYRVNTGKYHRLHFGKTLNGFGAGAVNVGDGIAYFYFFGFFDSRNQVAHIAGTHFLARLLVQLQYTNFIGIVSLAGVHEFHLVAFVEACRS